MLLHARHTFNMRKKILKNFQFTTGIEYDQTKEEFS
jgi:hypothetical protein